MGSRPKPHATPATQLLNRHKVPFTVWHYDYVERGGAKRAWEQLGLAEESVIKTLVMEDDEGVPLLILMHGPHRVSTKELARQIGCKKIQPCSPEKAFKVTGYAVGGTSPFGTRHQLRVFAESTIRDLDEVFINGGAKGFLVGISTEDLERVLEPTYVNVAI
ncbi:MAG: aminoacyl-tRNA deacylase [Acidobacteria bacterium]|nr:aminoacyl-tRNA deacylase [Acidobacteriota bacterium]